MGSEMCIRDRLTRLIRNPGSGDTAEEVNQKLKLWDQARKRARALKLPDLSPRGQRNALDGMVRNIEVKHAEFLRRLNKIRCEREADTPTENFVRRFREVIEEDLGIIEANEKLGKDQKKEGTKVETTSMLNRKRDRESGTVEPRPETAVSYTHLTLPTKA